MKKVSLIGGIFLLSLGLTFWMFEFHYLVHTNEVFAAAAPQGNQHALQDQLSKPMQPDPWTRLSVNHDTIRIYADRVVPETILTFNFRFGNKGTLPTDSVIIICFPPNMSLPIGASPLTQWVKEDSKGPIDIKGPTISKGFTPDPSLVTKVEWQVVSILPATETEIDTNHIQFKLSLVIPRIEAKTGASLDLQCWMGLFFKSNLGEPIAFDVVTIRVEFMPIFEVEKQISPSTILPEETTIIEIRTRNNGRREAENAVVRDYFYSSSGTVSQCIEIVSIDTPATDDELPDIEWQNLKYQKQMSGWKTFIIIVRAKPYEELKTLFNGAPIVITDFAKILYGTDTFDSTTASFQIVARDLEPQLEPKLFGNYASPGFPLLLHGWISNSGSTPVYEDFRVKIWSNDQKDKPFYDEPVTQGIEVGSSYYFPVETPPLPEGDGEYVFYIEADYPNDVSEVDETNNLDSIVVKAKLETFKTTVNNSTRTDEVTIFGKQPAFPDPVFSYVMITDQNYHYIRGLADPKKWLAPEELTPLGATVQQVWSPVLEYHEEDSNIPDPAVQNVYLHPPAPTVARIDEANSNGFSVALIIDGNMNKADSTVAAAAAQVLIQQMRAQDQMAVIKFSESHRLIKNFTKNRSELEDAVAEKFPRAATHRLYDAIYNGTTATVQQPGRKAVFVYTSAKNNGSSYGLNEVVSYADSSGVPVFAFGFGNADQASLQEMAARTGGLFIYEKETRDMWYIFKLFAEMFQNYYVLAHTTTDTTLDGTWRLVDVTDNYPTLEFSDSDIGKYKAPNIGVDLFIKKEAETVLFSSGGIDTIRYVNADEIYTYRIHFGNLGSLPGVQVQIKDVLPDSVDVVAGSFNPDLSSAADNQHQLFWTVDSIKPGEIGSITFKVRVKKRMPPWQIALIDSAFIRYDQDQKLENNASVNVVYANPVTPPPPILRATPEKIRPRDPIRVELQCFEELRDWDLKAYFEDGTVIENIADDYIAAHPLLLPVEATDQWHLIVPEFKETQKHTDKLQEKITFKLTAQNVYGQSFEPEDFVIVEASFECVVHPIIIKPGVPGGADRVYIDLTLTKDHTVSTTIYNVAGELVRKLEDLRLTGGDKHLNALAWDVRDDSGNLVASDVYVIVVKAGSNEASKKVVVIR